jgi:hypothetical protein
MASHEYVRLFDYVGGERAAELQRIASRHVG